MISTDKRALSHVFSLLHADHVHLNYKWNYSNVISPYFRVYYVDEGEGQVHTAQEKILLEPGYLYLIPSFTLCNLRCKGRLSQYFLHLFEYSAEGISLFENYRRIIKADASEFDVYNFKRLLKINPGRGINRSDNPEVYEKSNYYVHYQELNNNVTNAVYFETQGIIFHLISRFLQAASADSIKPAVIPSKVLDTINYVQLHLHEKLTVEMLAKRVKLNEDHFSRLFLRFTGRRPVPYINSKRIERAQYLITTTDQSFAKIAETTGFDTVPYFSKVFKKITTLTPGEYRKKHELYSDWSS